MSDLNQQPSADHSVKIAHLVFGLLFLGVAGIWALAVGDVVNEDELAVIGPAVLIAAGVIGLAASLASARNRSNRETELNERITNRPTDQQADYPADHQAEPPLDDHTEEIR